MKLNKFVLAASVGAFFSLSAQAQVEFTVTGATAFRAITIDRAGALMDPGYTAVTNNATTGLITYSGTVSNAVPTLGATQVKLRLSFSGSAAGMNAVKNQTAVDTAETQGVNVPKVPDVALSDAFPGSAAPPIPESAFERSVVGVVPIVFVKNNGLAGVTNITRDQAVLLMTASGDAGMPASYLGGASQNPVYLIGRDSGSGTRIVAERSIGFTGTPLLWATNGLGGYVTTNGYSSGGLVRGITAAKSDAIGYMSLGDYIFITNSATVLSFNGVPFSTRNVENGSYSVWGYEHLVNRVGGLSANQTLLRNALVKAITDQTYQNTSTLYAPNFVNVNKMEVERGADGGVITSKNF